MREQGPSVRVVGLGSPKNPKPQTLKPKPYLWPEKPTFLGFLIMVSAYIIS